MYYTHFVLYLFTLLLSISALPIKRSKDVKNVIYYVPHQDDDSLGYSLAIAKDLAEGNNVKVIIYIPNRTDRGLADIMTGNRPCPLVQYYPTRWPGHPSSHSFNMTLLDVQYYRQQEFERSMAVLGVKDYESTGWGNEQDTIVQGERQLVASLYQLILRKELDNRGTIHKCLAGPRDCEPWGKKPSVDHIACWTAAKQIMAATSMGIQESQFMFYDNYQWFANGDATHYTYTTNPSPPGIKINLQDQFWARQKTAEVYKEWDPLNEKFAMGYHSVHNLFYGSENDPNVYLEFYNETTSDLNDYSRISESECNIQSNPQLMDGLHV